MEFFEKQAQARLGFCLHAQSFVLTINCKHLQVCQCVLGPEQKHVGFCCVLCMSLAFRFKLWKLYITGHKTVYVNLWYVCILPAAQTMVSPATGCLRWPPGSTQTYHSLATHKHAMDMQKYLWFFLCAAYGMWRAVCGTNIPMVAYKGSTHIPRYVCELPVLRIP